jgi:4-hydroxy-tetrahydrodipicolinate synthase
MLTRQTYRGLFAYPPTPFRSDLSLDEDALRRNLQKLIGIGVDGLVLAGTSGEFYTLSQAEYRRMAVILREETAGKRVHSLMGAIGLCTAETVAQTRVATEEGIDGVLVVQPYYLQLTTAELLKFWRDLCTRCPDIGIVINHFDWIRQPYSVETYKALKDLPNLLGSKEAHWSFETWHRMHTESPLVHMSSTDVGWLVELHRNGAVGVGSLQVAMAPHVIGQVLKQCSNGDYIDAERTLAPLTEFIGRTKLGHGRPHVFPSELAGWENYSNPARHKALINAFGFLQAGPPREPNITVPEELQVRLVAFIHRNYPHLIPPVNIGETASSSRMWPAGPTA